jgi:hypothetical protein
MKKFMKFLIAIISVTLVLNACRKDENDEYPIPGSTNSTQVRATISGRVLDETGSGLQGVIVSAYGIISATDVNGIFLIQGNVDKDRSVLEFNKTGYMKRLNAIIPSSSNVNYVNIILQDEPSAQSFESANGGSVSLDHGGSVTFPANAFVIDGTSNSYNGLVTIFSKHISPDNSNFSMLIPGGDLSAVDVNGDDVSLYSYGMASVTIRGSGGENLQIASGLQASITFPIAASQTSIAPQSIPLWFLDETDALWKEEGQATRVGNNYVGIVSHFTWWNCDYSESRSYVNGRVIDCEGTTLANVTVTIDGGITVTTDGNGYYTSWVPSAWPLTFQALPQGNFALPSQLENVAPLLAGQNFTIPDLIVPCGARITGQLVNCNGENTGGYIYLKLNNEVLYHQFIANGSFNIITIPNSNQIIYASSQDMFDLINVTTPGVQEILSLGELHLCDQISTLMNTSFTIDGVGYANTVVHLGIEEINYARYNGTYNTECELRGMSNVGDCQMIIRFDGNNPTTVDATSHFGGMFALVLNGISFVAISPSTNHLIFIITEYGAVGDSIKGTFQGDVEATSGTMMETATLTNGKFAFIRTQ